MADKKILSISARRAVKRILVSIKTIDILHQKQLERADQGRVIAEISDYALAYQLIFSLRYINQKYMILIYGF